MSDSQAEKRWVWWFAVVVMLVTTIPYLIGFQMEQNNSTWRFSGLLFGIEDGNSYIAKMLLGASGPWLFRTPYTAYLQSGMLAFLPYMMLGKLTAPPGQHGQLVFLFHLFRIGGGIFLILAEYRFISLFVKQIGLRRLSLAMAVLGGGLGWLAVVGANHLWSGALPGMDIPLEYYSPETFGFLMILGLPHLAFARGLLLLSLEGYLAVGWEEKAFLKRLIPGILCLMIGFMQPLSVVVEWAVLFAHLLVLALGVLFVQNQFHPVRERWSGWLVFLRRAVWIVVISSPAVLYNVLVFKLNPVMSRWEGQNLIVSPPVHHYLLAFGLILPLSIGGLWIISKEKEPKGWLLAGWVLVFPLLAYAPYNLQRRLPEAIWVALVVLAVKWIESSHGWLRRWSQRYLGLGFLSTLILFMGSFFAAATLSEPVFQKTEAVRAYTSLSQNVARDDVVLASFATSNALPAYAPVRVLLGSGPESINAREIEPQVQCFFQPDCSAEQRDQLLYEFHVQYVFWGPSERELGNWDPREASDLIPVYQENQYFIFQVRDKDLMK